MSNYGQYYQPQQQGPVFNLLARGSGIDSNEYDSITRAATRAYTERKQPLSQNTVKYIKAAIGGEWFVLENPKNMTNYDFTLSVVTGNDFLSFTLDNIHFQVCRLK